MKLVIALFASLCVVTMATPALLGSEEMVSFINSKQTTWKAEVPTYFRDWTLEEMKMSMGALPEKYELPKISYPKSFIESLPTSFDARQAWPGKIGPVMNQAKCGSCWAFGAAEAVSDRMAIKNNATYLQLAPLDLVSCDSGVFANNGCQGGQLGLAWDYIQQYGLVTEKCSPYLVSEGGPIPTCAPDQQPCLNFVQTPACNKTCADGSSWTGDKHKIASVYNVDSNSIAAEIMKNGPVEAAFTVYADFVHYKSGVYQHTTGQMLGGHAIKIIGWGVENGVDYWLVQNSWTTTWGAGGFFKIAKGVDECGIEDDVVAGNV